MNNFTAQTRTKKPRFIPTSYIPQLCKSHTALCSLRSPNQAGRSFRFNYFAEYLKEIVRESGRERHIHSCWFIKKTSWASEPTELQPTCIILLPQSLYLHDFLQGQFGTTVGQKTITGFVSHIVSARVNAITFRALDHTESYLWIIFGLEECTLENILEQLHWSDLYQCSSSGDSPPFPVCWNPTQSTASNSGASNTQRTLICWSESRGGPQTWSGAPFLWK